MGFLSNLWTNDNDRLLKEAEPVVSRINSLEAETGKLSDAELLGKTAYFRERMGNGASLDDILPEAFAAVFFYAAAYVIMNLGAFVAVMRVGEDQGTDNPRFNHFNGLADRSPLLALLLLVSLLSLAGIPPLVGFTGKWFLFAAAMKQGHALLVLAGVINSVISLFYYLTVIKHAYLLKAENERPLVLGIGLSVLCLALFAAIVAVGVYPAPLLAAAQAAFLRS